MDGAYVIDWVNADKRLRNLRTGWKDLLRRVRLTRPSSIWTAGGFRPYSARRPSVHGQSRQLMDLILIAAQECSMAVMLLILSGSGKSALGPMWLRSIPQAVFRGQGRDDCDDAPVLLGPLWSNVLRSGVRGRGCAGRICRSVMLSSSLRSSRTERGRLESLIEHPDRRGAVPRAGGP